MVKSKGFTRMTRGLDVDGSLSDRDGGFFGVSSFSFVSWATTNEDFDFASGLFFSSFVRGASFPRHDERKER